MPLFTFRCPNGHEFDKLASRDTYQVPSDGECGCVATAERISVNRVAAIGLAPVPRDQKNYRQDFADFKEASAEVDHHYSRLEAGGQTVNPPNYFREGVKRARKGKKG